MVNNRYAQLSQQEKAELFGIYAARGYTDLASIIADYNSYAEGGPVTNTAQYKSDAYLYKPPINVGAPIEVPLKYNPLPYYGDYEPQVSSGLLTDKPISMSYIAPQNELGFLPQEDNINIRPDLFSQEAKERRALKQRYAESKFNDKAKSHAGAQGAWQIMPITYKDYLGRGRGKAGNLDDPAYNRQIRDWVMGIIPRDLQEFWSEDDSDINKLAKLYAAYNWGAGSLRSYLRKRQKAGLSIDDPYEWVEGLNPETKRYVKYLAFDEDFDEKTGYTQKQFEDAAVSKGYMAEGGKIHIKPENRGKFTALKKRTGHSASWFKAHGTPAQKKMATFALNARKWKHEDGGPLREFDNISDIF